MIYGDRTRRDGDLDGKGQSATIVFLADLFDVDPLPVAGLPKRGDPYISAAGGVFPFLRCVRAHWEQIPGQPFLAEYTAQFSTEGEVADSYCEKSLDISLEPGPEMGGWVWASTGTPVMDAVAPPIPVGLLTIKMRKDLPPYLTVMGAAGKINSDEFQGYPAGCVLFLGTSADNSSDLSGNVISSGLIYKFSIKEREHKYFWRPPLQALDIDFRPIFWQNIDADMPYYTTDQTKIATAVWIHQTPGQSANPAGIGGWDQYTGPGSVPYYEAVDLGTVLDIPEPS